MHYVNFYGEYSVCWSLFLFSLRDCKYAVKISSLSYREICPKALRIAFIGDIYVYIV